nr:hypothetical protein [Bifidobacterium miconis]
MFKGTKHVYSTDETEQTILKRKGWKVEGVSFFATAQTAPKATATYRLYNPANGNHLLSTDPVEVAALQRRGWSNDGVAFYAPQGATAAVKRFHRGSEEHLYTADENEYQVNTTKKGYSGDGTLLYAAVTEQK